MTGKYLKPNAKVVLAPSTNEPQVAFEWNDEGAVLFEQITQRNLHKPLGIFLDNQLISDPTVNGVIKGSGVIEGLTLKEAQDLSIELNSGSLDVPLTVIQEQTVDATLGADSIRKSIVAGAIGISLIVLFMLLYYRGLRPGGGVCAGYLQHFTAHDFQTGSGYYYAGRCSGRRGIGGYGGGCQYTDFRAYERGVAGGTHAGCGHRCRVQPCLARHKR